MKPFKNMFKYKVTDKPFAYKSYIFKPRIRHYKKAQRLIGHKAQINQPTDQATIIIVYIRSLRESMELNGAPIQT